MNITIFIPLISIFFNYFAIFNLIYTYYQINIYFHILYIGGDVLFTPNKLLYSLPVKFNLGKCHYLTGKDISIFSNLLCIENTLTNLTCNCKNSLYKKFRLK